MASRIAPNRNQLWSAPVLWRYEMLALFNSFQTLTASPQPNGFHSARGWRAPDYPSHWNTIITHSVDAAATPLAARPVPSTLDGWNLLRNRFHSSERTSFPWQTTFGGSTARAAQSCRTISV